MEALCRPQAEIRAADVAATTRSTTLPPRASDLESLCRPGTPPPPPPPLLEKVPPLPGKPPNWKPPAPPLPCSGGWPVADTWDANPASTAASGGEQQGGAGVGARLQAVLRCEATPVSFDESSPWPGGRTLLGSGRGIDMRGCGRWQRPRKEPDGERSPVGKERIYGRLASWERRGRAHGWIEPEQPIEHPAAQRHRDRVFVSCRDIEPGLQVGSRVSFFLYRDNKGLGAAACRARSSSTTPPQSPSGASGQSAGAPLLEAERTSEQVDVLGAAERKLAPNLATLSFFL